MAKASAASARVARWGLEVWGEGLKAVKWDHWRILESWRTNFVKQNKKTSENFWVFAYIRCGLAKRPF